MSEERKSRYELFLEEEARKAQPTKECSKCHKAKALKDFHRGNTKVGVASRCKECVNSAKRKFKNKEDRFWKYYWARTSKVGDCIEWNGPYIKRLPGCWWDNKSNSVRRVVYALACGEIPDGVFVIAKCGNWRCVRHSHLKLATSEDVEVVRCRNLSARKIVATRGEQHWQRRFPDLIRRGEQRSNAKLTEDKVRTIRMLAENGVKYTVIAKQFCVDESNVRLVVRRKAWAHVQ